MRSGSGAACLGSTGSSNLDVEGGEAQFLALFGNVLSGKHSSVGGGFISVGLDLHSSGDSDQRFSSRQVSDVNECVIEGGKQVSNTEDFFSVLDADTADLLGWFFTTKYHSLRSKIGGGSCMGSILFIRKTGSDLLCIVESVCITQVQLHSRFPIAPWTVERDQGNENRGKIRNFNDNVTTPLLLPSYATHLLRFEPIQVNLRHC